MKGNKNYKAYIQAKLLFVKGDRIVPGAISWITGNIMQVMLLTIKIVVNLKK